MARVPRVTTPGVAHHVISRFVDRGWWFRGEEERATYLRMLGAALTRSDWRCLAYCLMSSHIHLAFIAGELPLSSWAQRVHAPFANWMNRRRSRLGPLFADRPTVHAIPVEREAKMIAYIHNNPVRAKVVDAARESTWSSHQAYLTPGAAPEWLHVETGLARAGCAARPDLFDDLVTASLGDDWREPSLVRARAEVRKLVALELGTPTASEPVSFPILARPFVKLPPTVGRVIDAVKQQLGADHVTTRRYARGTAAVAKRIAIHAGTSVGISMSDMGAALGVSRQRASLVRSTPLDAAQQHILSEVLRSLGDS